MAIVTLHALLVLLALYAREIKLVASSRRNYIQFNRNEVLATVMRVAPCDKNPQHPMQAFLALLPNPVAEAEGLLAPWSQGALGEQAGAEARTSSADAAAGGVPVRHLPGGESHHVLLRGPGNHLPQVRGP